MPPSNAVERASLSLESYLTAPHPCSYLPGAEAISQTAMPALRIDSGVYSALVRHGFRRSGLVTYRPQCRACQACVPVRLPVADFVPSRTQRRSRQKHASLQIREHPLVYSAAHFALFQCYQSTRHRHGGMDQETPEQYEQFLLQSSVDTRLLEFSENGVLRIVSLIDVLNDGLSSVYTFFEPDLAGASLGTYNILWQIEQCVRLGLPYLYLGYWIRDSQKMAYKTNFRPIEGLINGSWRVFEPSDLYVGRRAAEV